MGVWNHGLFKALLFLCADSVIHATHMREIDRLGGLSKTMPWTGTLFLVGAMAICGLPPLIGFVSELFVYLGLLQTVASSGARGFGTVIALLVLAMIGAVFLGIFARPSLGPKTRVASRHEGTDARARGLYADRIGAHIVKPHSRHDHQSMDARTSAGAQHSNHPLFPWKGLGRCRCL